jgi:hypothetical protein
MPRSRLRREGTGFSALTRLGMRMLLSMDENARLLVSRATQNTASGYRL